jgi:hypothetical protein
MASLAGDDIAVSLQGHIGIVEIRRPPDNFFDVTLLDAVAEGFGRLPRWLWVLRRISSLAPRG